MRPLLFGILGVLIGLCAVGTLLLGGFPTDAGAIIGVVVGIIMLPLGGYSIYNGIQQLNEPGDEDRPRRRKRPRREEEEDEEEDDRPRRRSRRAREEEEEEEERPRPRRKRPRDDD